MRLAWIALAALVAAGCSEKTVTDGSGGASSVGGGRTEAIVVGRIVDSVSGLGVAGATIGLELGGTEVLTAASAGQVANFPAGQFEVRGYFPSEPRVLRLRVTESTHAPLELCVFVPTATALDIGPTHTVDVGVVAIGPGVNLPVLVRFNGTAEPNARIFAFDPAGTTSPVVVDAADTDAFTAYQDATGSPGTSGAEDCAVPEIGATTDGSGRATLAGLDRSIAYTIVVAGRDRDGDGRIDYASTLGSSGIVAGALPQPLIIDLFSVSPTGVFDPAVPQNLAGLAGPIAVATAPIISTATAALADNNVSSTAHVGNELMTVDQAMLGGSVDLLFREPVTVVPPGSGTGNPSFFWIDNLVDPRTVTTTTTFPDFKRLDATATPLAGGTIWRFTPKSALADNEDITLDFAARGVASSAQNATYFGSVQFYRPNTTHPLSSSTTLTADNYNGRALDPSDAARAQVFLQFPEVVFGFYQILQFTDGTLTTKGAGFPLHELAGVSGEGEIVFSDGAVNTVGGAQNNPSGASTPVTAGIFYRVPLVDFNGNALLLADNAPGGGAATHSIRVQVSAQDAQGNRLEGIFDLDVQ